MRSAIRRMVPQAFRHRVSAELARFRSAALRRRFAALAAEGRPILAGPWLGEVGFEVLYWVPFLRWFAEEFHVDPARIIVRAAARRRGISRLPARTCGVLRGGEGRQ